MARRRRQNRWPKIGGIVLGSLGGLIIVAGLITNFMIKPAALDPETLCPKDSGPNGFTVFLLDQTDGFEILTRKDVELRVAEALKGTVKGQQVSLAAVDEIRPEGLRPIIRVCNPGSGETANPLVESARIVSRNWQEKFRQPLDEVLEQLLDKEKSARSPIMESIQAVALTHFPTARSAETQYKLIVISDFIQNSPAYSLYQQPIDYAAFQADSSSRGLNVDLRYVEVELWFVLRSHQVQADINQLLLFWQDWAQANGGEVVRVLKLSGENS